MISICDAFEVHFVYTAVENLSLESYRLTRSLFFSFLFYRALFHTHIPGAIGQSGRGGREEGRVGRIAGGGGSGQDIEEGEEVEEKEEEEGVGAQEKEEKDWKLTGGEEQVPEQVTSVPGIRYHD